VVITCTPSQPQTGGSSATGSTDTVDAG
jgi:hypothetical protein